MNIYHSYFEYGDTRDVARPWFGPDMNRDLTRVIELHELSVLLALKNYGNITLITNEGGRNLLGHLPYTKIELFDEYLMDIDCDVHRLINEFRNVWSLSKIFAYRQISKKRLPFLHIDYDVFLFKRLPEEFLYKNIICQQTETEQQIRWSYNFEIFQTMCPEKFLYRSTIMHAYNMGIFGGNDFDFVDFYTDECLKFLRHPNNYQFWKLQGNPMLLEQYWLAQCLHHKNVQPLCVLEMGTNFDLGYEHYDSGIKWSDHLGELLRNKIQELKH